MNPLIDPSGIPGTLVWTHLPYFVAALGTVLVLRRVRHRAEQLAAFLDSRVAADATDAHGRQP